MRLAGILAWSPHNIAGPLNIKAGLHQLLPDYHPPEPRNFTNYHPKDNSDISSKPSQPCSSQTSSRQPLHSSWEAQLSHKTPPKSTCKLVCFSSFVPVMAAKLIGAAVTMIKNARIMLATDILALARSLEGPLVLRLSFGWMLVIPIAAMVSLPCF